MMAGNHLTETFVYSVGFRGGARGTWASPYFQAEARRAEKTFLGDRPPSLSEGLDDPPPPPRSQGLDPALVCYRVLPRKREFIARGTQKHKSNAFPFRRTVQIANSPSPKNI